ncbi:MAG: metal-dependent hydrolase, partial [Methylobacteriaceae bacterium]|nr:metal-dependent hydrolase [Methylobacteriaceae bacterium]
SGVTHILITHGHSDHVGDTVDIARETGAKVITNFDLCMWLASKGVENVDPMNTGGTTRQDGFSVSLTIAHHSAGMGESGVAVPLGSPNGLIVRAPGEPVVYHMGDTEIFGDMALINEIYRPDILMVPIGDRFTMGAASAAMAVTRYFKPRAVFPCHYGSFPIVAPTAAEFISLLEGTGVQVVTPHVGLGVTI